MNLGICALCGEERTIVSSHLIPSWAYARLRRQRANPHPILVEENNATYHSKEIQEPLLCEECDGQRFGRVESDIARLFDIDEWPQGKLIKNSPAEGVFSFDDDVNIGQLKYFAISVIWRSHAMKNGVNLGSYAKPIKEYLLGKSDFPTNVSTGIIVLEPDEKFQNKCSFFSLPTTSKENGTWMHGFHFFGVVFKVFIGKFMPPELKALNAFTDKRYALVTKITESTDFGILANAAKNATARGKLGRDFAN